MDDTHQTGSIHLGVVMYSTAIALSETLPYISPSHFFTAVIAGYEAAARIAIAVQPKNHYALGFHPTATCGVFGAAVTARKLLGLGEDQMLSALGIAGSMAAGLLEFLADGSWTKRLHPGLAAKNGVLAAMLAVENFRGPSTVLEGRNGFLRAYSRSPAAESDYAGSRRCLRNHAHGCEAARLLPLIVSMEVAVLVSSKPDGRWSANREAANTSRKRSWTRSSRCLSAPQSCSLTAMPASIDSRKRISGRPPSAA